MGTAYVHCASCRRAFDASASPRCPACRRRIGPATIEDRVIDALDEIERALAEATSEQRDALGAALQTRLGRALPAATTLVEVAPDEITVLPVMVPRRRAEDQAPAPRGEWGVIAEAVVTRVAHLARRGLDRFARLAVMRRAT